MPVTVVQEVGSLGAAVSRSFPLGVSAAAGGRGPAAANVAVYAPAWRDVVLCYQPPGGSWRALRLPDVTDGIHHGLVDDMPVGTRYGFRVGLQPQTPLPASVDPEAEQLLLDPYGRYIDESKVGASTRFSSVRMAAEFDWGGVERPHVPWRNTVFYEAHVRGQTMLHPDIPEGIRGTYAGMAHPAMIAHLTELGVTSVELLPIHFHLDEAHFDDTKLSNYWGYNPLGFFAPHGGYASAAAQAAGPQAVQDELKGMIKLLHQAGIEVVLDVVFNHTAEGGAGGPALSWRGLADEQYYRHADGHYVDTTGCGNSLNFGNPRVIQLALDSLRYWVEEFHVDGFRFDLAVTLSRNAANEFRPQHPFLIAAAADPVLSGTKLVAEPWDVGFGGWQTGRFPVGWADWNDSFRDTVRRIWLSDRAALTAGTPAGSLAGLGDALGGSANLFAASGRGRLASVNLVTTHDGFTLADLTAFNEKHNEDNGEGNRDGSDNNRSWNHGVEGITNDPGVLAARARTGRNLMATLLLSIGVPLITAGDEFERSQGGNNNAYCQDNEITWLDWSLDASAQEMLAATKRLIHLRRDFLADQPSSYPARGEENDLHWYGADGRPMTPGRWNDPAERVLGMLIGADDGLAAGFILLNTGVRDVVATLPAAAGAIPVGAAGRCFRLRMTTAAPSTGDDGRPTFALPDTVEPVPAGGTVLVEANTVQIFRVESA
ncbi:glycogen debranching protein GlgX [Specibacter cremeus]|uniref:glycogen debranching protein GlgX n=1 Tax=Specibacter cremeus TaxID=1629051 RepID=UPI000F767751|nr:glycogen debranching protein GlgX [Specibacter cremeus]